MKSQLIIPGVVMAVIILAGVGSFLFSDGSAPPQPPPPSAPPVSQPAPVKETAPAPQPSTPKPIKNNIVELISQKIDALLNQLTETETACKGKVDLEFTKIDIEENKLTTTVIVKPKGNSS